MSKYPKKARLETRPRPRGRPGNAEKAKQQAAAMKPHLANRLHEAALILCFAVAAFLFVTLVTYKHTDALIVLQDVTHVTNWGGKVGAWSATILLYAFGYFAYIFPFIVAYSGWLVFRNRHNEETNLDRTALILHGIGFILTLVAGSGLSSLILASPSTYVNVSSGGLLGDFVSNQLASILGSAGATLMTLALFLTGITLLTGLSWLRVLDRGGRKALQLAHHVAEYVHELRLRIAEYRENAAIDRELKRAIEIERARTAPPVVKLSAKPEIKAPVKTLTVIEKPASQPPRISAPPASIATSARFEKERQASLFYDASVEGALPPLSLLDPPDPVKPGVGYSNETLEAMSREVETRLHDFGIEVQVVAVHPGPVITRFEMQLAPGVKVSRITSLAKDLARSLSTVSVRIVEVIPGKSVVGLELPNEHREIVRLSEVLSSQQYDQARSPLSMALGKDIAGHPVVVDLGKMPHLLVAGTTGSGKSVGLNAMLLSLLYKAGPDEVRMIMIDPKMLELSIYEGIPHLLAPVVVDMKEAANALRWCVAEMDRRYRIMAALGVRNLAGYNTKVKDAEKNGTPIMDPFWKKELSPEAEPLGTLPYIVVLVDEFADMIMVVGKKVEELIARIAQKARAAGIHLILATQRPSVDVITGLIKANVPTRIAFQVSSKIDSRTILDQQGAEQLLGHGDMLYLAPGTGVPVRVHGAFVADHEVHKVVSDWKRRGEPNYITAIVEGIDGVDGFSSGENNQAEGGETDALYDQAVQIVIESRRASISNIQRRLKIGYNRAARLIEEMERAGLVTPMESNGSREVLVPATSSVE
jgi:S-DNA-T family DNA segregation ATPase FtsK/SpoIIIE